MKICGLTKTTLLDYPGKVATTVFLGGCNFRCPFCHNGDLVLYSQKMPVYEMDEIMAFFQKRKNVLEGVCISGGEPTLYDDLPKFITDIKNMGYLVKLDTNGTNPQMMTELVDEKLVDYIAMDIKASPNLYEKVCNSLVDMESIQASVNFLLEGKIPYEFRTTMVKEFHTMKEMDEIGQWIKGAKSYYLQNYQETDKNICKGFHAFEKEEMEAIREQLGKYIKNVACRGVI